ncbi:uncharacterized protein LOC124829828 [Vigna umbellata]|uniref:uncharacterized protein LOC124829828 n=1 Tax=Vigna umbellata TaxID=87088 RepID=UPI001F5F7198|nr:uncharacterized protein LOC124829828 [Vigna umbellata]
MDHLSGDEYVEEVEEVGIALEDRITYKDDFKEAIRSYVVHTERALKFVKNDKRRVRVRCMGGQGQYKVELLTTIGRDPNDQMLPIAYAVVEVENKDTWGWFLQLLVENLGGKEVCGRCTWMSDQQKGLMPVVSTFRKIHNRYWSRSRFTTQAVCDSLDNNISEAFNSVIVLAREKPIITMLEEIRLYLMKRWVTNRSKVASMDFTICPKIKNKLMKESNLSRYWIPSWSGRKLFKVRHTAVITNKFTVDLKSQHCSCRKWMISGIPCCHANATMNYSNEDPQNFIPSWFTRSTYEETYASMIYPVNGKLLWERTSYDDVLPPILRKLPGRPKKKRKLEAWELTKDVTQMIVGGHRKKCTIYRQVGHNRKNCPLTSRHHTTNMSFSLTANMSPVPRTSTTYSGVHSTFSTINLQEEVTF